MTTFTNPGTVYFEVPNSSGYGPRFDTFAAAVFEAQTKFHSEYVRAWVTVRVRDASGDREIHRVEISPAVQS